MFGDALQLQRGLTEADPMRVGETLDLIHILCGQPPLLHENRTDRTAAVRRRISALYRPFDDFIHFGL
jgi:hypothetical protein